MSDEGLGFLSNYHVMFEDLDITGNIFQIDLYINPVVKKTFFVSAFDEQEAIDKMIDFIEENIPGLLLSRNEEREEEEAEGLFEYVYGGNHCRYLCIYWSEMDFKQIYQKKR